MIRANPSKHLIEKIIFSLCVVLFCSEILASAKVTKPVVARLQSSGEMLSKNKYLPKKQSKQPVDRYLVVLKEGAVASQLHLQTVAKSQSDKKGSSNKLSLTGREAIAIKQNLTRTQQQFEQSLKASMPGVTMKRQFQTLVNAVELTIPKKDLKSVAQHSQVKGIYPVRIRHVRLDRNHEVVKSVEAWTKLGGISEAGKGVKIAVIDTGIRNDNPMFDDTGFDQADLSDNDYLINNPDYCRSATGMANFCNNKLIVARWIDPANHDFTVYENEHFSPLDFDGHGSHVAGIASGVGVEITYQGANVEISGVAPASHLMVYKALWVGLDGFASAPDTMLLEALEHAVNDGADVINNSWGGGGGEDPQNSIYQEVFSNAEDLGIVIVNAAGNDLHAGRGQSINCPACISSGIAVANTTHGRFFGHAAEIDGQSFTLYGGENSAVTTDLMLTLASMDSVSPLSKDGCEPWTEPFFQDAVVMVDYIHTCTLEEVAENVKSAGGSVALIYQSGAFGMGIFEPFIPYDGDYVIPVLGVSRQTGLALFELAYTRNRTIQISSDVSLTVEHQYSDMQHPFSSTGPNSDASVLKPDMAAPGTHILSALSPDEFVFGPFPFPAPGKTEQGSDIRFGMLTGTSMASPHVAGAAALMRQQYPEWTAGQIKSALTSTSHTSLRLGAGKATPFGVGAGRLDIDEALDAPLTFDQVSFADPACIGRCTFSVNVKNMLDEETNWELAFEFDDSGATVEVDQQMLTLSAANSDTAQQLLAFNVNTAAVLESKWVFGELNLTKSNGDSATLPIAVFANDASDAGTLTISSDSGSSNTDDIFVFNVNVRNKALIDNPSLSISLPDNLNYIGNSAEVTVNYGQSTSLEYVQEQREILWKGELNQGQMMLTESQPWGTDTLSEAEVPPISCSDGCLHVTAVVDFDFEFNGEQFTSLTLTDNGFVVPGDVRIGDFAALFNQKFPQPGVLNNVIAPFWTEFDLLDELNEFDTGGGFLRSAIQVIDGTHYLVVEWDKVVLYDNEYDEVEHQPYTFQLIIQENTSNIWFNYLEIPSMPVSVSIGAENIDGSVGVNRYYDGEGIALPNLQSTQSLTLQLTTQPEGQATVSASFNMADNQTFSQDDEASVEEDAELIIDVLANDTEDSIVVLAAKIAAGSTYNAIKTIQVESSEGIDETTLEITQAPANGSAEVVDGKIKYVPNADFFGSDNFQYRVADRAQKYSVPTHVKLSVTNLNDPPSLSAPPQFSASESQSVTLKVEGEDKDNDSLTYDWVQIAGPVVSRTSDSNSTPDTFTFITPAVRENTLIAFRVTANDGVASSQSAEVSVQVERKGGGGAFSWILLSLFIVAVSRRLVLLSH